MGYETEAIMFFIFPGTIVLVVVHAGLLVIVSSVFSIGTGGLELGK